MPHEKIHRTVPTYGQQPAPVTGTNLSPVLDPSAPVHMVWAEVGSRVESITLAWVDLREVQLTVDLGKEFVFTEDEDAATGPEDEIPVFTSLSFDLSRHEINRLIKALRRARDSAYGRDE